MRQLHFDLLRLLEDDRRGSHATRCARRHVLARVRDAHVRMALRLQAAFGLRREEAIKLSPSHADRGDRLLVKASTAKGGPREVPVRTAAQRRLLDEARQLAGHWKAPVRGGPSRRDLEGEDRDADRRARTMISRELGHGRASVTAQYVG